ncbi:E3 ubiquitin-protein ligase TRIM39-like [Scomber japonicus]|uniref:E3 ubiquitin-protein ligase TRIM39-like n=1 Tax=Scomber japonicus TaxID=13676 RepID=UPI002305305C|nr:E3 ubiquitin-protein ligase TRIM39-like [Scomber japonicus]
MKAVKSCLMCMTSYCESHLEPHLTMSGLMKHHLIDPVENLEDRMCMKHDQLLEMFCKDDQTCICTMCKISDHKKHEVVPLKDTYEQKKAELGKTEAGIQQMIHTRLLKIQEIKQSVELSKAYTNKEIAEDVEAFTKLKESVEKYHANIITMIEEKQKRREKQSEDLIKELEKEISLLKKRSSELEQLSHTEDQFNLLQNFKSLNAAPRTKDWTKVIIPPQTYDGAVKTALDGMVEKLNNLFTKDELMWARKYEVDVTLDPDTANPKLILSDDGKQVHHVDEMKNLPDNPERFTVGLCVFGKQSISSGRFYFEVQVKDKPEWFFGVARESIDRKGRIKISCKKGYWTICLRNENYFTVADTAFLLSPKSKPEKVGVFVDYDGGVVSFYDVDAEALIHSFTSCSFSDRLLPFLSPGVNNGGKNSTPLIISPVHHTE